MIDWGNKTGFYSNTASMGLVMHRGVRCRQFKKELISLISSITNQGKARFVVYQDMMNAQTLIKFL